MMHRLVLTLQRVSVCLLWLSSNDLCSGSSSSDATSAQEPDLNVTRNKTGYSAPHGRRETHQVVFAVSCWRDDPGDKNPSQRLL
jgi:hypothetical protein